MIKIPDFVTSLAPYRAGKPIEELIRDKQLNRIVRLASNENPLGPSPKAVEAIQGTLAQLNRYTDPVSSQLVQALAHKYGIQPEHIICGHGADSLIAYAISAFTEHKDEILTCQGTFVGLYTNARKFGRRLSLVPLKDWAFDLGRILDAISADTKIVYLANPNNPTGTMFGYREFEAFMDRLPDNILVILDEAYTTYAASNPDYPNGVRYDYENMVVMRTLSKAYGLGGLRIGFAVGPKRLIDTLYKVKLPFEPNLLAQVAAVAALDDDEFLKRTVEINSRSLEMMRVRFDAIGVDYVPSTANFTLLLVPDEDFARRLCEGCLDRGLIVRHVAPFGIPNGIRVSSGTVEETEFALAIIGEVYRKLAARCRDGAPHMGTS